MGAHLTLNSSKRRTRSPTFTIPMDCNCSSVKSGRRTSVMLCFLNFLKWPAKPHLERTTCNSSKPSAGLDHLERIFQTRKANQPHAATETTHVRGLAALFRTSLTNHTMPSSEGLCLTATSAHLRSRIRLASNRGQNETQAQHCNQAHHRQGTGHGSSVVHVRFRGSR